MLKGRSGQLMYDPDSPFLKSSDKSPPSQKSDQAEVRLREAVLWCELAPGATATEVELAERFGLGRAATRAALAKLSAVGFVHAIPRLGWRVLPVSGAHIGQIVGALEFAEEALADCALEVDEVARLKELAGILQPLAGRSEAAARLSRSGYERELRELVASKINPYIATHLHFLWDCADRIVRFLEGRCDAKLPARDSQGLVAAVIAGDRDALRQVIRSDLLALRELAMSAFLQDKSEMSLRQSVDTAPGRSEAAMKTSISMSSEKIDIDIRNEGERSEKLDNQGEKQK